MTKSITFREKNAKNLGQNETEKPKPIGFGHNFLTWILHRIAYVDMNFPQKSSDSVKLGILRKFPPKTSDFPKISRKIPDELKKFSFDFSVRKKLSA